MECDSENTMSTSRILISMKGIGKTFLANEIQTRALEGIDLEIHQGEYVCIAGPSGCGKTTLLSIIGLLQSPTEGRYTFEDESVERLSAVERASVRSHKLGFIFQAFNLIGDLTVAENVALPLDYQGIPKNRWSSRVQNCLTRVGMDHRAKHYPGQL